MVRQARDAGIALTGLDGLLKALTVQVVEVAFDEELNEHLGYGKHDLAGRRSGNSRNGTRSTTGSPTTSAPSGLRCPGTAMAPLRRGWSRNANDDLATWMPRC